MNGNLKNAAIRDTLKKTTYLGLDILGIVPILFGTVFALQGDGILGGSAMSGNAFWIYTGSVVAVVGL